MAERTAGSMLFADVVSLMAEFAPAGSMVASEGAVSFTRGEETVLVCPDGSLAWVTVSGRKDRMERLCVSSGGDFLAAIKTQPAQVDITVVRVTPSGGGFGFRTDQPGRAMSIVFEELASALWDD